MPVSPSFKVTAPAEGAYFTYTDPMVSGDTDTIFLPYGDSAGTRVTLSKYSSACYVYTATENASIQVKFRNGVL
jgi:hypothetical protein